MERRPCNCRQSATLLCVIVTGNQRIKTTTDDRNKALRVVEELGKTISEENNLISDARKKLLKLQVVNVFDCDGDEAMELIWFHQFLGVVRTDESQNVQQLKRYRADLGVTVLLALHGW